MTEHEIGTCSWLVEELIAARIVERNVLAPHLADFTAECPYADADAFAAHLIREGILSKYQAKRSVDGDAKKLILGAYLLVDVIGNGSLGPVYKAFGRADQKPYAVKVLPKRSWNVRLARNQVRAFEDLAPHEGIVPFLDVGTAHGLHYLVWPFIEGRTLESLVREHGPLSPGEVARIGLRIAEALKVTLRRGLVHGLIKPSNILISAEGQAKLLDFGIGALLAENPEDDMVDTVSKAGSLAQMLECAAPEHIADSAKWHPPADQYSLGCTLYFTATGRFPFPGGSAVDKIICHQFKKPISVRKLNPDLPPGLADVIERLMSKAPGDRYSRLDDLICELAPLATVSCVQPPVPVDLATPAPPKRLQIPPVLEEQVESLEPPVVEVPPAAASRGLFGRIWGRSESSDGVLQASVVAGGPARGGQPVILHVYVHTPAQQKPLTEALRQQSRRARVLGSGYTRRGVAFGSRIGLHLGINGATIDEPLQECEFGAEARAYRFIVTVPPDGPQTPLKGRLMVGQDGKLLTQIDFVLPMAVD